MSGGRRAPADAASARGGAELDVDAIRRRFRAAIPAGVARCALRVVRSCDEALAVRQGLLQPPLRTRDAGAMITVDHAGATGYGATGDLSTAGLRAAALQARSWAERVRGCGVAGLAAVAQDPRGSTERLPRDPWDAVPLGEKLELLRDAAQRLRVAERIVDWEPRARCSRGSR